MNTRQQKYLQTKIVRLARENPEENAEQILEWAQDEIDEENANDPVSPGDMDEPKDHAYNDCFDRNNPACAWAY